MCDKFKPGLNTVWRTCNKIRTVLLDKNLSLHEFFRGLDCTGDGLLSESKFLSVFAGKLRPFVSLSDEEIIGLTDYFKIRDGRIYYKQLCDVLCDPQPEAKDTITGLEWEDPMHRGQLTDYDKKRLCILIAKIAQSIRLRDIVLRPYFQDYELVANNHGYVTFSHFFRVLAFLGIRVSHNELQLLTKAYMKDGYTLNYVAFLEDIESNVRYFDSKRLLDHSGDLKQNYPGYFIDVELPKLARPEIGTLNFADVMNLDKSFHPALQVKRKLMTPQETLNRIKRHVLNYPVKLELFFKGFDHFNTRIITRSQFTRALDTAGVSGFQKLVLFPEELNGVATLFEVQNDSSQVYWRDFVEEVNTVYGEKKFCKDPLNSAETPDEIKHLPKPGSQLWDCVPKEWQEICQDAIYKIKATITKRSVMIEPLFQEFDRHRTLHVSLEQSRRVLTSIGTLLTHKEIQALEKRYADDLGFNYQLFLKEVIPLDPVIPMYEKYRERKLILNTPRLLTATPPRDIIQILADIKAQAVRKRVSIVQFMSGSDTLKHQKITKSEFTKALQTANIHITLADVEIVCDTFKSLNDTGMVEYRRFCDTIEEAFSQRQLEKAPLLTPLQHILSCDDEHNFLNFEERTIVSHALQKLARQVHPNLLELFEDYDREKIGRVNHCQFLRALTTRNLHTLLSSREVDVVFKCFSVRCGSRQEMKYREFLNALILVANTKVQLPN